MLQHPSSNRNDGMSDDSSSEGEEEGYSLSATTLKICTDYLARIKMVQEELNNQLSLVQGRGTNTFPVLKAGEEWNGIRDEEIEAQLLNDILNFLCSPEHVDYFVSMYEFIELYFSVMATNTSICVASHIRIVKCLEEYYHFYVLLANEDRYSDSRIIYENTVIVNIVKYLMKFLGEMSKCLKGKNLKYLSLFMHGIAILDKYLLKLISNQRILKIINDAILNFSIEMFNTLLPSEEDNTTDANCDSVTLICGTLSKIPIIRQFSHTFILKKYDEYQNQPKKLWNTTFQLALLIGLFTCKGYDDFLFTNLQHSNELVAYTCIWSLGTVCEDKKPLITKLQHIYVTDSRAMIKRSILKIFSTYVMQDEHIGMDMYDSIFKILPLSVTDDLRTKSYDTLTSSWFLMSLIIKKSQNRDTYIFSVIDLFDDLEKSMSLQCAESGSYAKIDPGFKKVHAVYFKLLSDKKVLKYLRNNLIMQRKLRESVFVSLRRMLFSVRIVDKHFTENLEDYMGVVVGLMDDEMIRYMKEEQLIVSKCLFKANVINKQMGNSYFALIAQLGVHLEDILTIKEIFSLLTERMLFQIPKKITLIDKYRRSIEDIWIKDCTKLVFETPLSRIIGE
ncbi:predicted protein [Naegleria gruberi]|uniref:Predicted protein n=1 Tax=Naegleria gruberi TaxID=5762 RepID=D2V2P8_NAEGR|nr:uncharacterized protein NAEGRDRAFT_63074 [Naegleria gruberi]EFC48932.1 predicted protein [Naegleria gruberi]|eukprot:XP_002681676.1 predicted protein [Naegleria gruberi strain NEG-M]